MNDEYTYFGEWVEYRDEKEKEEALQYLQLWKKFFLRKISDMELNDELIIYRPHIESFDGIKMPYPTIGIKIEMKGIKPEYVLSLDQLPIPR